VLTPPDGLSEAVLKSALARGWNADMSSLAYRAVGFGSHHWEALDAAGARWFVTVDELQTKQRSLDEPLAAAFGRLRASLSAARDLRDCGAAFVVAPVPARDGEPLVRLNDRLTVALYPFVEGHSFTWGEFTSPAQRRGMLDLIVGVHTAPAAARRHAGPEDFAILHRDELELALGSGGDAADTPDCGPYARPAARLLTEGAPGVRRMLARYDELAAAAPSGTVRPVLTHGEPHPGNTMLTAAGWMLIDWDTVLVAPPERDLWSLDPGDGSVLRRYAEATGVTPRPSVLELYRIGWDLADIAVIVSRFRMPHPGNEDDDKSWYGLRSLVAQAAGDTPEA
jgi:spectinomycin phosphotransferase/16S rRNA (guanine(1405)-N(7))-methyltransferase